MSEKPKKEEKKDEKIEGTKDEKNDIENIKESKDEQKNIANKEDLAKEETKDENIEGPKDEKNNIENIKEPKDEQKDSQNKEDLAKEEANADKLKESTQEQEDSQNKEDLAKEEANAEKLKESTQEQKDSQNINESKNEHKINENINIDEPEKEQKNSKIINKFLIKFDMLKILSIIQKDGSYKEGDYIFEFYKEYQQQKIEEEPECLPKYFVDIKYEECRYLGVLSNILTKEIYGYNIFQNKDEYFGHWNNSVKEGYGIYYFKENEKEEEEKIKNIYIGEFKKNKKSGEGLYFKIKNFEEGEGNVISPKDFIFSLGIFSNDEFKEGIIYNIEGDKRQIYKGKLNEKGEKTDEKAEIYENNNQIFHGALKNNIMIKGRIIVLKNEENVIKKEEAYYFERKEENLNSEYIEFDYRKEEEMDDELIKKMQNLFEVYDCEKLKNLYIKVIEIREKLRGPENFKFIKDLDYDVMIKEELKKIYEKYIYMD